MNTDPLNHGPLADLNDMAALDELSAFGSLARSRAAPDVDLEPEQALDVLAGLMARRQGRDLARRCESAIDAMAHAVWEAAKKDAPELADGFAPAQTRVNLRPDSTRPGWTWGVVETTPQGAGCRFSDDFHCRDADCVDHAVRMGAQNALRAHPEFEYVTDFDYLSPEEKERLDALLAGLRGADTAPMVQALEDRARFCERDELADWLCERVAQAAKAGLLPADFEHSGMRLWGGMRGADLLIARWDLLNEGDFLTDYSTQKADVLDALSMQWGFEPSPTWTLPPLDAGREAAWGALCEHLVRASAFDWQKLPRWIVGDFPQRVESTLQARELGAAAAAPSPSGKKARL
jgi:hypothetical protein